MFGRKRAKAKAVRDAKIRIMMGLHPDKIAALCWAKDQNTADMAQAVIVVKWLAEHGYLPGGAKPTGDDTEKG